ncbi:MAG: signal recognition particle-docking protein FtsY [Puniceicoccales bacterium]|nr:signal recognition particle-docking protein FtsY [Puniceicoccales bacterium]
MAGGVKKSAGGLLRLAIPYSVDGDSLKNIENALYSADFGVDVTGEIIGEIKSALKQNKELRREKIIDVASRILKRNLSGAEAALTLDGEGLRIIFLVGVNGSGKTTTAAKLAHFYENLGKKVLLGSCDTFRAAANEQLNLWGKKLSIDVVSSHHGADPAAVAFDAHRAAIARGKDILILDTAGRLHVKSNLMAELQKMLRVLRKSDGHAKISVWLVMDGTIGTNSIESAKVFHEGVGLTGLVVTKLDGTSAGGALVGVYGSLRIPIYFVGIGESMESLSAFSVERYVDGLLA